MAAPLQRALRERNYSTPSPVQAQTIPLALEGRDLIGCAQTGTGKTAAFSLPILHHIFTTPKSPMRNSARALILVPTRELAVQVSDSFKAYGAHMRFSNVVIFGGVSQGPQERAMRRGADVLVATPGRLIDLMNQRIVNLDAVEFFVLDEVDRMLDMGFIHDVKRIVAGIPQERQSLFFSATMAPEVASLAEKILHDPARVTVNPEMRTADRAVHKVCFIEKANKGRLLEQVIQSQQEIPGRNLTLVFSRTKHGANKLAKVLTRSGFRADAIHGNKSQAARQRALEAFRNGSAPVLVATDVAARGIDVKDVTLVVNYDVPNEPDSYVHRIGRTARAGAEGLALSFCSADELSYLSAIERLLKKEIDVDKNHPFHDAALQERHASRSRRGSARPAERNGMRGSFGPKRGGNRRRGGPRAKRRAS